MLDANSIQQVFKLAFGQKGGQRGRIFVTCLTKEEVLVITDNRPTVFCAPPIYCNFLVPTICGKCVGSPGSEVGAAGKLELSNGFIQKSDAYEAIAGWCDSTLFNIRHVDTREVIMAECQKHNF
ncbi:Hypothetical protein D9617_90g064650 [Elsinoe fawcettii]|nr:Hypothetical protein D9617_90g064650 [Elsinoe fawcettii]